MKLEKYLMDLVPKYNRWVSEGKPSNFLVSVSSKTEKQQCYYDPYHDHIKEIEPGLYEFNIQTENDPYGDTWISGKFIIENNSIKVLIKKTHYN